MAAQVPKPQIARPGANPTLATIELIAEILERAGEPISRNRILDKLGEWGHGTNRPVVNAALAFLTKIGRVYEGSKGLMWVPPARGKLLEYVRAAKRL